MYRAIVAAAAADATSAEDRIGDFAYLVAAAPVRDRRRATRSSPCRWPCGSTRSSARSTISIARVHARRAVLHPARRRPSATRWPSASPIRCSRLTRATRRIAARRFRRARSPCASSDELRGWSTRSTGWPRSCKRAARPARADAPARGVGRDGAPGRARHQEPADADPALGRAPAARPRRSRRAARPGARRAASTRSSRRCGCCGRSPSEFSSFASSPTARPAPPIRRAAASHDVVDPYRVGLGGRDRDRRTTWRRTLPPVLVDRTLVCAGAGQHRRERAARDARRRARCRCRAVADGRPGRDSRRGHRRRHGRGGAGARLRALLLDQGHRHRPGPADRAPQHRDERRHRRRGERKGRRHDGDDRAADGVPTA